jgi:fibro-slime domain-containing protein
MKISTATNSSNKILLLTAMAGTIGFLGSSESADARPVAQNITNTLSLRGIVRNFRETTVAFGHTDFGNYENPYVDSSAGGADSDDGLGIDNSNNGDDSDDGVGVSDASGSDSDNNGDTDSSNHDVLLHVRGVHTLGHIATTLDTSRKPVFMGTGQIVSAEWRDPLGREINPSIFDAAQGDFPGMLGSPDNAGIEDNRSYRQWYRSTPGKNIASMFTMDMRPNPSGNGWIFTDQANTPADDINFYGAIDASDNDYTIEMNLQFEYLAGASQYLTIGGMDDVYVFINGQLAIDLGGVDHGIGQTVLLDRLNLNNGDIVSLDIFMAQRTNLSQDFLLETSFDMWNGGRPTTSGLFD